MVLRCTSPGLKIWLIKIEKKSVISFSNFWGQLNFLRKLSKLLREIFQMSESSFSIFSENFMNFGFERSFSSIWSPKLLREASYVLERCLLNFRKRLLKPLRKASQGSERSFLSSNEKLPKFLRKKLSKILREKLSKLLKETLSKLLREKLSMPFREDLSKLLREREVLAFEALWE